MTGLTMVQALNDALRAALVADPKVLIMGEDIGKLGGVFRVTDGLQKDFGEQRVIDTPLGESGIIGSAIGLALRGYRPICEIQFDGFVYPAYDQIVSQLAKFRNRSGGQVLMPVVIRIPYGGGIGAVEHHSESPESYFVHTAGLKVVTPSTPADAFVMLQQAVLDDDPVVFFEPKRRYWDKGHVDTSRLLSTVSPGNVSLGDVSLGDVSLGDVQPLHSASIVRPGRDATLVAYGPMVRTCLDAATAALEEGRELEVIDLRSLSPWDIPTVLASVERTGHCIVVHEAPLTLGLGAEIAATITERAFYSLEAPVLRVTGFDTPYPASKLEEHYLPDLDRVLAAVDKSLAF